MLDSSRTTVFLNDKDTKEVYYKNYLIVGIVAEKEQF